jgi:hypothetical protein
VHPRQIVDAVNGAQLERGPAELPGASRLRRLIQHDEPLAWCQPALLEVVRRGQAGLASSDDDDVGLERDT